MSKLLDYAESGDSIVVRFGKPRGEPRTFRVSHVYVRCMARQRTNIEIEDDLVRTIMSRYAITTKTEAVDLALRHLAGQAMSRDEALAMRGAHAIDELPVDVAPHGAT
ncbi:type II toxin-antitoxin system VapB family antitoxin [Aeromicrobium sp. CF3.5]|uniref:type II toxin-antitoxin system VapB family antitoxin n=1 Tax=Aeromicrobium sp. CF3.5 TaxID=3373078 RepID=UPI003EE71EEA